MKPHPTAASLADCNDQPLLFQDAGRRQVVADFSGGTLSTDGGALLLRQVDRRPATPCHRKLGLELA